MEDTSLTDFLDDGEGDEPGADATADPTADATTGSPADAMDEPTPDATDEPAPDATDEPASETVDGEADDVTVQTGEDVPPATPTAAWSPADAVCDACGEPAAWRWRDGDALVCAGCKSWA